MRLAFRAGAAAEGCAVEDGSPLVAASVAVRSSGAAVASAAAAGGPEAGTLSDLREPEDEQPTTEASNTRRPAA